jgi:hypothetical protein
MKRPEKRTGGPEAASPLRRAFSHGQASPSSFPEARSVRFRRLDDPPPKLRSTYPEPFFYAAPKRRGDRRWASSLVAAMLSLTLASSMIALALLGGTVAPGALSSGPRRLRSDAQAPTVQVRINAPSELVAPAQNAGPATGAEASVSPPETSGPAPTAVPPAPPAVTEAVANGGTTVEGFEQGTVGTGQGGGGEQGGQVPPPGEGGIVGGGDGTGIDADGTPPPPPPDTDDDSDEGGDDPDEGGDDPDEGEDDPDEGEDDPDEGEDDPDEGEDDPDEGEDDPDEGEDDPDEGEDDWDDQTDDGDEGDGDEEEEAPESDQEMPPAVGGTKEPDVEAEDLEED